MKPHSTWQDEDVFMSLSFIPTDSVLGIINGNSWIYLFVDKLEKTSMSYIWNSWQRTHYQPLAAIFTNSCLIKRSSWTFSMATELFIDSKDRACLAVMLDKALMWGRSMTDWGSYHWESKGGEWDVLQCLVTLIVLHGTALQLPSTPRLGVKLASK